jgi:hypothetical protein
MNMKVIIQISAVVYVVAFLAGCTQEKRTLKFNYHTDKPFIQDYSIKYFVRDENVSFYFRALL